MLPVIGYEKAVSDASLYEFEIIICDVIIGQI
jgi:hypothetical protein